MPKKRMLLTKFRINAVLRNQKESQLVKNIKKFDMEKRWAGTGMAQKLNNQKVRAGLSDFDRHVSMVLRRRLSKAVRGWVTKNKARVMKAK